MYIGARARRALPDKADLAVLSASLPPDSSGQAVVLFRLLEKWGEGSYCLLSQHRYERGETHPDESDWLAGEYVSLPRTQTQNASRDGFVGSRVFTRLRSAMFLGKNFAGHVCLLAQVLRVRKTRFLLVCSGDPWDLPAAAIAAGLLKIPFGTYLFDWYAYQWTGRRLRWAAGALEPWILRRASLVITHSPALRDRINHRYGIRAVHVPNPADSALLSSSRIAERSFSGRPSILFAGAIYAANEDALQNLVVALEALNDLPIQVDIYSDQRPAWLQAAGKEDRLSLHAAVPSSRIGQVLATANIVFLPLTFGDPLREVVETAAPAKMSDYLALGRPILVHAPAASFVSEYFKAHECGLVVDENNPAALASAIRRLLGKPNLRAELSEKAWARAKADFDPMKIRVSFQAALRPFLG